MDVHFGLYTRKELSVVVIEYGSDDGTGPWG